MWVLGEWVSVPFGRIRSNAEVNLMKAFRPMLAKSVKSTEAVSQTLGFNPPLPLSPSGSFNPS